MFSKSSFHALTRTLALIICLLALTYSSAQQSSPVIGGTVINSVTREPVSRALVTLYGEIATLTNDEGRFEFRLQQSTEFSGQFSVRRPGFTDTSYPYSYLPNAPNPDLIIPLLPESLIIGHVNLPTSNQYDRIGVDLYQRKINEGRVQWTNVGTVAARSNGDFRFANLEAGTYKLFTEELADRDPLTFDPQGQHYGYPPIYFPNAQDFASAAPIQLGAGQTLNAELSPVLRPYFPVKIPITNMPANAYPEITVAAQGHRGPGFTLGFDDQSIVGELPNGSYTVEAALNNGSPRESGSGSVQLTVNSSPSTATLTFLPNSSISVHVKKDFSERTQNNSSHGYTNAEGVTYTRSEAAQILLQPADEFRANQSIYLRPPRKNNDADLVFDSVPPGRYWVFVQPHEGYVASITSGGLDLLHDPLPIGAGTADPIEIVLRDDVAHVEGTVDGLSPSPTTAQYAGSRASNGSRTYSTNVGGSPTTISLGGSPSSTCVYAIPSPDRTGPLPMSGVSPDGTFSLGLLAPGTYRILAFDCTQRNLDYRNPEAMRAFEDKGPLVRLAPNQTEHVRLTLIHTID